MNEKDVEKLFEALTDPPCAGGKGCEFWDRQGHYCFLRYVHKEGHLDKCEFISQIVAALRDEPQVDEEGLLTDTEIIKHLDLEQERRYIAFDESEELDTVDVGDLLRAQLSADNARWQRKVEELIKEIEDNILWQDEMSKTLGIAPSGNKAFEYWQSLKSQIGGRE